MNVVIIGTGNVATVLGKLISSKGHKIVEVVGRNAAATQTLAHLFTANPNTNFTAINDTADLYIIAVVDTAIETVTRQLTLQNKLVVHTAGSVSIQVLNRLSGGHGVLWPLQTLRKEMKVIPQIPIVIDANTEAAYTALLAFTKSLTDTVFRANDAKRIKLHLTAVLVSNFTNHLYTLAEDYCHKESLEFKLLLPLIQETGNRVLTNSPRTVQTGPAIRGDNVTINNHLQLLKSNNNLHKIYQLLSDSIKES